jgi:hypothetical protein
MREQSEILCGNKYAIYHNHVKEKCNYSEHSEQLRPVLFPAGNCFAASEIFKITNRLATDVLPVVESLLSPQGRAVADRYGNTIVVNDSPAVIAEIRTILLTSDQRLAQVRVEIAFDSADSGQVIKHDGYGSRPGRRLSTDGARYGYPHTKSEGRGRSFLTISSGSSGYIRMAKQVPVTSDWMFWFNRYGVPFFVKEVKTIETGFEVSPVAVGDQVIVTVTPRISWTENGRRDSYRFAEAATTVTISRSQWFDLGGVSDVSQGREDLFGVLLSTGDYGDSSSMLMRIKADVKD